MQLSGSSKTHSEAVGIRNQNFWTSLYSAGFILFWRLSGNVLSVSVLDLILTYAITRPPPSPPLRDGVAQRVRAVANPTLAVRNNTACEVKAMPPSPENISDV